MSRLWEAGAACKKQQKTVAALAVVDAVARADVDLQFRYATRQMAMRARIAMNEPVYAHQDSRTTDHILQVTDPLPVLVCLLDAHAGL
jgi:hypothetical protein